MKRIEKGMMVDVVTNTISNPVVTNGAQSVVNAFMCIYGIGLRKVGAFSRVYLDVKQIR